MTTPVQQRNPLTSVVALVSGMFFGFGLALSEMMNPRRVLGFLDVAGAWDPTLAFVMLGALVVTAPAFFFARRLQRPVCDTNFRIPANRVIDRRLVLGAALFGVGWGLVGFCPGPALAALITGRGDVLLFVLSMLAGMGLFRLLESRRPA
jgi:uncharacterized membrane protein YedE/YeeE